MTDKNFSVFVVEDDEWYNRLLVHSLSLNPDIEVESFVTAQDVLKALHKKPAVITLDYRLPDMMGDKLLLEIKDIDPSIEIIVISEQEDITTALDLLKIGAFDYIVKSKNIRERLLNTISHIRSSTELKKEVRTLRQEVGKKYSFEKTIIGQSPQIKSIFDLLDKAVTTNITLTVTGETGTGKEVVAKAIHFNSKLKDQPFVAVNMGAIPSELVESELFGHEKGAFTGALTRRIGKFEEANGGTLFLDEIGEMDLNSQVKLLRALQEKEITRVGGNTPIKVNGRIIVATNRDLLHEVKEGNFREDLYYRLLGLPIHLPPLRERGNDILILANHFVRNFCEENDVPLKQLSPEAKDKLLAYSWPGNIRELKSVIELAVVLANSEIIDSSDLSMRSGNDILPDLLASPMSMREYERKIVSFYMDKLDGKTKKVAEALDIGQTTVYRILKENE